MIHPLFITVPIAPAAFHRLGMEAKANGVSLDAYVSRISEQGFGVPVARLVGEVLTDAANAAATRAEGNS